MLAQQDNLLAIEKAIVQGKQKQSGVVLFRS